MFSPIIRQLDPANSLTLLGLILGFYSAVLALSDSFYLAAICLVLAGIIDLFDGVVARKITRTDLQRDVGKQLDSLVDLCSFGFAPAIFAYSYGLQDGASIAILIAYLCANALRLAYFNCTGMIQANRKEYFTGLPVTYAALFIPLAFAWSLVMSKGMMLVVLRLTLLGLTLAMLANFKMLKLKGVWYGIFAVGAVILTGIYLWAHLTGI